MSLVDAADVEPEHEFGDAEAPLHILQLGDAGLGIVGDAGAVLVQLLEGEVAHLARLLALAHGELVPLDLAGLWRAGKLVGRHLGVEPLDVRLVDLARLLGILVHEERQQEHALHLLRVAAQIAADLVEVLAVLLQLIHPRLAVGAVGEGRGHLQVDAGARRLLEALRADGRLVDGRMRLLHGLGQQLDRLGDGPELALVGDLLLRPGLQDDVEALGQHLAALVHRHAEADEFVRLVGAARRRSRAGRARGCRRGRSRTPCAGDD